MVEISKDANTNYLGKVICINNLEPIEGADKIQTTRVDFQTVVISKDFNIGDYVVYFPVECSINSDFLSETNSYRDSSLNKIKTKQGFFDEKGRVKAIKLFKGTVKSCGYIVPVGEIERFTGIYHLKDYAGQEFDTINGIKMLEKYVIKNIKSSEPKTKQGKKPKVSRLVEGQVHLHVDSENYRKNVHKIKPLDIISLTYKLHGTSATYQNVLVKKKLNWKERLLKKLKFNIVDTEYDLVITSRKVVKNNQFNDFKNSNHFYGTDVWTDIANTHNLKSIPKGYSLYGEIVGYTSEGKAIQKDYDYECTNNGQEKNKFFVYRITYTNVDGVVSELSMFEIEEFCQKMGLKCVPIFFMGYAKDLYPDLTIDENWNTNFIQLIEKDYLEKDCYMCNNKVPAEGVVIKREQLFSCEPLKLKSFSFLEKETKELDRGEENIEDSN